MKQARTTDLFKFLMNNHADEFELKNNSLRMIANHSISIKNGYCGYVDFSGAGLKDKGNSVDFLVNYLGYSIQEAVSALCGTVVNNGDEKESFSFHSRAIKKEPLEIPLPAPNNNRVIAYLTHKRGISADTVNMLIERNLLWQDKQYGNCIFMAERCDWGERRGTGEAHFHGILKNSREDGFWHLKNSDEPPKAVFICESAIDAISLYELYRIAKRNSPAVFVSIGGAGKQKAIDRLSKKPLWICTDNDKAGNTCRERNSEFPFLIPTLKDWNEDLLSVRMNLHG